MACVRNAIPQFTIVNSKFQAFLSRQTDRLYWYYKHLSHQILLKKWTDVVQFLCELINIFFWCFILTYITVAHGGIPIHNTLSVKFGCKNTSKTDHKLKFFFFILLIAWQYEY